MTRITRRGQVVAFIAIAAGFSAAGGVAYACTLSAGGSTTYATPASGNAGTNLTVETWVYGIDALKENEPGFYFRYLSPATIASDPEAECHHQATIGASVSTNSLGNIGASTAKYSRTFALGGTAGTGFVCWATGDHETMEISRDKSITVN